MTKKRKMTYYTQEFKNKVVAETLRQMKQNNLPEWPALTTVTKRSGVNATTARGWLKQYTYVEAGTEQAVFVSGEGVVPDRPKQRRDHTTEKQKLYLYHDEFKKKVVSELKRIMVLYGCGVLKAKKSLSKNVIVCCDTCRTWLRKFPKVETATTEQTFELNEGIKNKRKQHTKSTKMADMSEVMYTPAPETTFNQPEKCISWSFTEKKLVITVDGEERTIMGDFTRIELGKNRISAFI